MVGDSTVLGLGFGGGDCVLVSEVCTPEGMRARVLHIKERESSSCVVIRWVSS